MKHTLIFVIFFISSLTIEAKGPFLSSNIDKDSLFMSLMDRFPKVMRKTYIKEFKRGNIATKDFMLYMLSLPISSKEELIENWETKKQNIIELKEKYSQIVPFGYIVDIEFDPGDRLWNIEPNITMKITFPKKDNTPDSTLVKRNMLYDSTEIKETIKILDWNDRNLNLIKELLEKSNCTSIVNGESTTVGFKRSGMGKYYYLIFNTNLDAESQARCTDRCNNIFYKDNVVLQYFGGAFGPQCFSEN